MIHHSKRNLFQFQIIKKNFVGNNIDFSFNLYFVHVEPDTPYIYEITMESKINELKNEMDKKKQETLLLNDEIRKLKDDSSKLQLDSENKEKKLNDEIKKLKSDSENKEKKLSYLAQEISNLKNSYKMFEHQNNLRAAKKKARKEKFDEIINKEFGMLQNSSPNQKLLIGNIFSDSFITLEHLLPKDIEQYQIIIDTKTFCRVCRIDNELEEDIENKHFKNLEKYILYKNKLILIVDYVFMKSFNQIQKNFNIKGCQISLLNGKIATYFKLEISKNDSFQNIIFKIKIPGNIESKINFNEVKNI